MPLNRAWNGVAVAILAGAMLTGLAARARACSCYGPNFWQIHRRAQTIVYGTVSQHVDRSTPEFRRADFVVQVEEVLRGRSDAPTVTFHGGTGSGSDCNATASEFPVGTSWVFILDGGPSLNGCSGRFLKIGSTTSEDAISLAEVKRRLRHRGPSQTPPTRTPTGAPCGATLRTWLECNDPRVRQYLDGIEPYEQGAHLEGVQLSDFRWVLGGEFVGRVRGLGAGAHVYVLRQGAQYVAIAWVERDGAPLRWPACPARPAGKIPPDWLGPGDPGSNPCGLFYGDRVRIDTLKPGQVVARCDCVPEQWLKVFDR